MKRVPLTMLIVFVATWRQFGVAQAVRSGASALRDIVLARLFEGRRTDPSTRMKRIRACEGCPIFFPGLGTCGIPGDVDERGRKIGCWCPRETASYVRHKECWRGEAHGDSQW